MVGAISVWCSFRHDEDKFANFGRMVAHSEIDTLLQRWFICGLKLTHTVSPKEPSS